MWRNAGTDSEISSSIPGGFAVTQIFAQWRSIEIKIAPNCKQNQPLAPLEQTDVHGVHTFALTDNGHSGIMPKVGSGAVPELALAFAITAAKAALL